MRKHHKQLKQWEGFIGNKQSHWYAIRRLRRRWWIINSTADFPEHLSENQLESHINGLQNDGYSVFVAIGSLPGPPDDSGLLEGNKELWWKEDDMIGGRQVRASLQFCR